MKIFSKKNEKIFSIIELVLCALMIITGIILLLYSNDHTGVGGTGIIRASTSIKFGADFYTTVGEHTGLAANAVCDIYVLIKVCFGLLFVFSGGLIMCKKFKQLITVSQQEEESLPLDSSVEEKADFVFTIGTDTTESEENIQ